MPPTEDLRFCCIHKGCGKPGNPKSYKRWNGLQAHNNDQHADEANFINLSTGKQHLLQNQKLERCFVYKGKAQDRPATVSELQRLEDSQNPKRQAPDGGFDTGQPDKRSQHERHLLTTVVCYLASPNSKDPLSAARAALDELQKAAIHAIADDCAVQGTQCNSCKLSSQIHGWKGARSQSIIGNCYCSLCRQPGMPLVCLTKKNRLKYLQTLLQEATPNDLLPLPMTEEEVFQRLGSTKPTVQTCTVDIDVIDVAELLISMGDSLKEQAKGPNNRIAALVKQTKSAEDNADAVIEAVRDTDVYFSCNMQQPQDLSSLPEAVQKLVKLRQHFQSQEWWEHAFGYQDPSNATLWLIGSSKHGSQFHVDWSEAKNIAWATDGKAGLTDLLAIWAFLNPAVVGRVHKWLRHKGFKTGLAAKILLNFDYLQRLQRDMGVDSHGEPLVHIVRQCHGDIVHVPAGWMHMVQNVRACIKMAWDMYTVDHLTDYVLSWQHVASRLKSNRPDYMAVMGVVTTALTESMLD